MSYHITLYHLIQELAELQTAILQAKMKHSIRLPRKQTKGTPNP